MKRCFHCWDVLGVNLPGKFLESSRGWLDQFAAKIFPGVLRCCLMVILCGKPRVFHINCCKFSEPSQYLFVVKGFQQMLSYVIYVVSGTLQSGPQPVRSMVKTPLIGGSCNPTCPFIRPFMGGSKLRLYHDGAHLVAKLWFLLTPFVADSPRSTWEMIQLFVFSIASSTSRFQKPPWPLRWLHTINSEYTKMV